MLKLKTALLAGLLAAFSSAGAQADNPRVLLETSHGDIVVELFADKTPATVDNFLGYVESGFYDGTVFHRVIENFMIQGGGFTPEFKKKTTGPPIENEAENGVSNTRGTLAMARTGDPHSATSQFFINTADNPNLDFRTASKGGWGYCAFGRVVEGMDVVDRIAAVPTTVKSRHQNAPKEPVIIEQASVLETGPAEDATEEAPEAEPAEPSA